MLAFLITLLFHVLLFCSGGLGIAVHRMPRGFNFALAGNLDPIFIPVLKSSSGLFTAGFAKATVSDGYLFTVACEPQADMRNIVWSANPHRPVTARAGTELLQHADGSLELRDGLSQLPVWATGPASVNATLALADNGSLQLADTDRIFWQSFEHPTDTILPGQNLTAAMSLVAAGSENYTFRVAATSLELWWGPQLYWRHEAMQEKALIVPGAGPTYARLESDGYIAMYQRECPPADVLPLNTYHQRNVTSRLMRIESDGNLVAYYWRGHRWEKDFTALDDVCDLPAYCGPYATCAAGGSCRCLYGGGSSPAVCPSPSVAGNLCAVSVNDSRLSFDRFSGVDLPFRRFADTVVAASETECEAVCHRDCRCAAVAYENQSRTCYPVADRLLTVAQLPDDERVLLVKKLARVDTGRSGHRSGAVAGKILLAVAGLAALVVCAVTGCRRWRRRRRRHGIDGGEEMAIQMSQKLRADTQPHKTLEEE